MRAARSSHELCESAQVAGSSSREFRVLFLVTCKLLVAVDCGIAGASIFEILVIRCTQGA